jgi:hypothetical protein
LFLWDLMRLILLLTKKNKNCACARDVKCIISPILDRCIEKFSDNAYDIDYKISMLI